MPRELIFIGAEGGYGSGRPNWTAVIARARSGMIGAVRAARPARTGKTTRLTGTHPMTVLVSQGSAAAAGATVHFESRGQGPPLVLITGAGGDGGFFDALADRLAADYRVLTYDRRGNSRSPLHGAPRPLEIAEQSADVLAVLDTAGVGRAHVFGTSGGATIALDLAAGHPARLGTVVAHEPPLPLATEDPEHYYAVYAEIEKLLLAEGWRAAFGLLQQRIGHIVPQRLPSALRVLLEPDSVLAPGPFRDYMGRLSGNWEFMTRFEMLPFVRYQPDLERIAAGGAEVVPAAGAETIAKSENEELRHDPLHRPCLTIAACLGVELVTFPGGHLAAAEQPGPFARALAGVLGRP